MGVAHRGVASRPRLRGPSVARPLPALASPPRVRAPPAGNQGPRHRALLAAVRTVRRAGPRGIRSPRPRRRVRLPPSADRPLGRFRAARGVSTVAILWMRRDLRLADNPALTAAAAADRLVPVFCLDPRLLDGRHRSGSRTQFMLDCLHDVDRSLRELGSRLIIRRGKPEHELAALARDVGAREIHAAADVGPYARARDKAVSSAVAARDVDLVLYPGTFV